MTRRIWVGGLRSRSMVGVLLATVFVISAAPPALAGPTIVRPAVMVEDLLEQMTLEEKVGQLFISRVYGDRADESDPAPVAANRQQLGVDNAEQLIAQYHVGGIIYFAWAGNVASPGAAARLSNGIQRTALEQPRSIPVLISTDQEGGSVVRLRSPATQFAGSMALGATRRPDLARSAARVIGRELKAVGIRQVLAPVADVNVNPANPVIGVRSFGSSPSLVATMTAAQVKGFQIDAGVAATVKHFPGHGDTNIDSHSGLPVINHTVAEWSSVDAPPFEAAIDTGVDVVMTAHLAMPALDPSGTPATLSRPVLTELLREELGFDGVIVTDSLGMGALRDTYGDEQIPVLALQAGADMLLNPPRLAVAYNEVLAAVSDGRLTESRIDQSVARILALKQRFGLFESSLVDVSKVGSIVGSAANRRTEKSVANASITLIKNNGNQIPLGPTDEKVLVTGVGASALRTLASFLATRGIDSKSFETGASPTDAQIAGAVARSAGQDAVILLTANVDASPRQRQLVEALVGSGSNVIAVAVRRPYDIAYYVAAVHLATYSDSPASMRALARIVLGERAPVGRLPVAITDPASPANVLYPFGHGLSFP